MGEGLNAALLQRDHRHLVHSLHNEGGTWPAMSGCAAGHGPDRRRRPGDSSTRCPGLAERDAGLRPAQVGRCRRRNRWPNSPTRRAMPGAPTCAPSSSASCSRLRLSERPPLLLHVGRRRVDRRHDQDRAATTGRRSAQPGKHRRSTCSAAAGVTLAAMCATGMPAYWPSFEPRMPGFVHIPNHDRYRYVVPPGADPATAAATFERAILAEGPGRWPVHRRAGDGRRRLRYRRRAASAASGRSATATTCCSPPTR